jgi:hypothetical protein
MLPNGFQTGIVDLVAPRTRRFENLDIGISDLFRISDFDIRIWLRLRRVKVQ